MCRVFSSFFALVLLAASPAATHAQDAPPVTPADLGYAEFSLDTEVGLVRYFVSTGGRPADTTRTLPLVVYLQGSGFKPLYSGSLRRLRSALLFEPGDFPGHHFVVIAKPAAPFFGRDAKAETPQAYHQALSLAWRVEAARAVSEQLVRERWVDVAQVVVIGHSEGADVAPWLALAQPAVTHVVALCGGVLSQAFDPILAVRQAQRAGTLADDEATARIDSLHGMVRRIARNPAATDSLWWGDHSYLRWSSFFTAPPLDAFMQLDRPLFVGGGLYDEAAPVENLDYLPVAFALADKENLTYRIWPTDHYLVEAGPHSRGRYFGGDVLEAVSHWLAATSP